VAAAALALVLVVSMKKEQDRGQKKCIREIKIYKSLRIEIYARIWAIPDAVCNRTWCSHCSRSKREEWAQEVEICLAR